MFLNEGDALVFRGANGPWKTGVNEYHLKAAEAKNLISKVLDTFKDKHGKLPKEFFIHGRYTFNDEEWDAFKAVAPKGTNVIGVRIKTTNGDTKLFRNGDYPVLRGTAMLLDERNAYLWTNGFVPRLDTYIGPETPNPLYISILRSSEELPNIRRVLGDIMGLTKINYNACNYNDGLPVTIRFANKVGDVLTMGSAKLSEKQQLKYYV
jgi:signal peptidase I